MTTRIVYMGTPDFACPALKRLASMEGVTVDLVVTQPDRTAGRGRKLVSPPVKTVADELGLPVYQTHSLKTAELRQPIVDAQPDLIVVAAFGVILGRSILELPTLGCVNLHASLLPQYRGAAPISAAILGGDAETGVSLMRMEAGLDTGPVYAMASLPIAASDTTESLTPRLADCAADLLERQLAALVAGQLQPTPQPSPATLTRPTVKADGWLDWSRPAIELERQVRAMWSWPRAWTALPDGTPMQVHVAALAPTSTEGHKPQGGIHLSRRGIEVACGEGALLIETAQLPGGRPISGPQLVNHRAFDEGIVLGGEAPETPGPMIRRVQP